jgi:hypothetical protein
MATHEVKPSAFPAQARAPLTITSAEISRYAEISVLVSQLEKQQKTLRAELLGLHKAGAKKETDSPYLLAFVEQEWHTVNWKSEVLSLAAEVYVTENVITWKLQTEQAPPVPAITQIRVKLTVHLLRV